MCRAAVDEGASEEGRIQVRGCASVELLAVLEALGGKSRAQVVLDINSV